MYGRVYVCIETRDSAINICMAGQCRHVDIVGIGSRDLVINTFMAGQCRHVDMVCIYVRGSVINACMAGQCRHVNMVCIETRVSLSTHVWLDSVDMHGMYRSSRLCYQRYG